MSLRDLFSRNTDSLRRKKARRSSALAAHAEFLEDRVLLSVENPLLQDHGVAFRNGNVTPGTTSLNFFPVNNPFYSNNPGGSGLDIDLDASIPGGNQVAQLRNIRYSNLIFSNNGNTGSSLDLRNMTLDTLVIDSSQFIGNDRAGLIINLTNMQIGTILITNSSFTSNNGDALCLLGTNSRVNNILIQTNIMTGSLAGNGILLDFEDSRLGTVNLATNQTSGNALSGIRLDLDNTTITNINATGNFSNGNGQHAMFLNLLDSEVRGQVTSNNLSNSQTGDGLRVQARRSVLPNGTIAEGLRNLNLDVIRNNTITGNGGVGLNVDLGQNTTFASAITTNTITNNDQAGLNLIAKDTQDAFNVRIGGETVDPQNNNLDANTIDGNGGAGIAITLDDTSSVIGNTSGRFQILNNVISNSTDDNNFNTPFAGEGIFVRARGSIALVNGAARILNSRIDGNTISGNASHGMAFEISEDSEVVDLLIGDVFDPTNPNENFEGDGFILQGILQRNSGNIVQNNGGNGVNFFRRDAAIVRNLRIIDNMFEGNADGINITARNQNNFVSQVTIQHNDSMNNRANGIVLTSQIDAFLNADLDNNTVQGNQGDGILTLGFEGDATDAETLGGVWTRNVIQDNAGKGLNINGVVGVLSPLTIGMMGTDSRGRSMGNLIDSNGDDGIEINSPGFIEFMNNVVTSNGQANGPSNPHGDGKGIDINLNDLDIPFNTTGSLNVFLGFNVIQSNFGDGVEIISRGNEQFGTLVEVLAYGNIIDLNSGRGVDVLNAGTSDTYIVFGDGSTGSESNRNIIRSNGLEGFYTVNTSSTNQRQDVAASVAMVADTDLSGGQRGRSPNLTLDINGNEIQQNGEPGNVGQLDGSGLVIRVGTTGSLGTSEGAAATIPDRDGFGFNSTIVGVGASNSASFFANGRVNARVNSNAFGGNRGVDVITESFVSTLAPPDTAGTWNATDYDITGNSYRTDPLARLNLELTNNTGNSVDLVRLGAFYNNAEADFKSREAKTGNNPSGPFGNSAGRFRNAQRLPDRPSSFASPTTGTGGLFAGGLGGVAGTISAITPGGPTTPIVISTAARAGIIQGATNATPIVITSFGHGLSTGEFVEITGVQGNTAANGVFMVTVIDQNTFSLQDPLTGADVAGNANYLSGGSWSIVTQGTINNVSGDGVSPIVITSFFHGLTTGQQITVVGVEGNTNANGTFTVTVIDQFAFSLDGTTGNGQWGQNTGAFFTASTGHGLQTGDTVAIQDFSFNANSTPGFDIDGIYDVTVISPNQFLLNGTEGETNVPTGPFLNASYREVTNSLALMYPGVGPSTFRIIEAGNNFPNGTDFTSGIESQVVYAGGGTGHLSYTFDREAPGTFNFRTISISDVTVAEGNQAEFVITLSQALDVDLVVSYRTEFAGSANDGVFGGPVADYVSTSDTVVIPAGQTQVSVFVDTLMDDTFEDDETFKVFIDQAFATRFNPLTGAGFTDQMATPIDRFAVGTIVDSDPQPTISISDAVGFEQGQGTGTMTFTVTLSNASGSPVFVDFATAAFTASADLDYRSREGTLTFAPGETSKTITIEILPDVPGMPIDQDLETLFVNLTSPQGATIADAQGVGTIFDTRFVNISDAVVSGDGTGSAVALFEVTLTDALGNPSQVPIGQSLTINYSTQDGTATAASGDYTAVIGGTLILTEGQSAGVIAIPVSQDRLFEGDETFRVNISSTQGTVLDSSAVGRILENLEVAASRDANGQAVLKMFDLRTGTARFTFNPYPGFGGEVRVATGDFNGDGIADIVTAPGRGGGPHIKVFNGADGSLLNEFMAYTPLFTGGVFVAVGDINGDLVDDIITGPDAGGGPHVRVFDALTGSVLENFFVGTLNLSTIFTGGVRVASGNVDGFGPDEIIVGFGPGTRPLVEIYTTDGNPGTAPQLFRFFDAYTPAFQGGVYVSAADVGGGPMGAQDGLADIITGAGAGGGPHVKVFSGGDLSVLESFFAYAPNFTGGVRVASGDVFNDPTGNTARDRVPEIITAPGVGGGPHVRAFSSDGNIATVPTDVLNLFAFASNNVNGVFISGRARGVAGEGSPLRLDGSSIADGDAPALTEAELASTVNAAIDRLSAAGADSLALARLRRIEFVLADLEGDLLGWQTANRVLIDRTAAGRGYFVDLTPGRDEEFVNQSGRLVASDDAVRGRVDLLTVIFHELSHALGEEHFTGLGGSHHLLAPTLLPGERRLPEHDSVFASGDLFESLLDLS